MSRKAAEAGQLLQRKAQVIDVRTPQEFASAHLQGAINVPVDQIEAHIAEVVPEKTTPLLVHCRSGGRSARAKAILDKMGYTDVKDLGSYANAKATVEGTN